VLNDPAYLEFVRVQMAAAAATNEAAATAANEASMPAVWLRTAAPTDSAMAAAAAEATRVFNEACNAALAAEGGFEYAVGSDSSEEDA
jgi:cytochrome c5